MTPTQRLLTILRLLKEGGGLVQSEALRAPMGHYEGAAGRRKFRRDLRELEKRGLVETGLSTPRTPNRTGIRLRWVPKPLDLELTAAEHAALKRARQRLRPGPAAVAPIGRRTSGDAELDLAARVVRFLEENDDEVEIAALAGWLALPEPDVRRLLDGLMDEHDFDRGIITFLEPGFPDEFDDDVEVPLARTVYLLRAHGERARQSPVRDRGMAEIGFFPYSLEEAEERLSLIEEALGLEALEQQDDRCLRSARGKLGQWRAHLLEQDPMS